MSKPQKASLLLDCISRIHNKIAVTIDNKDITTMSDFVSWLLENK